MKVFVTVGTTSFDPLVEALDKGPYAEDSLIQIADGSYQPGRAQWFRFEASIQHHINEADVVVCHAGAGSVFRLLQSGMIPLVVPNTVRRDQHQLELARWLERRCYAVVSMNPQDVNVTLDRYFASKKRCIAFAETRFFYQKTLNDTIRKLMPIADTRSDK